MQTPAESLRSRVLSPEGFTLVELLVSMSVLALIVLLTVSMITSSQKTWTQASESVERFRDARVAFEAITRRASQAVLNTYWDYDKQDAPTKFIRQSELHFICGPRDILLNNGDSSASPLPGGTGANATGFTHAVFFQAPIGYVSARSYTGSNTLLNRSELNACGYYLDYAGDTNSRPIFLRSNAAVPTRTRYRLFEYRQPSERFAVYLDNYLAQTYSGAVADGTTPPTIQYQTIGTVSTQAARRWYSGDLNTYSRAIADNVIALVISPRYPGLSVDGAAQADFAYAPFYLYDSRGMMCGIQKSITVGAGNNTLATLTAHVLPPVLDITMVALDEGSAARYASSPNASTPLVAAASASGGKDFFKQVSTRGSNASAGDPDDQFQSDLAALEKHLVDAHLNYEVFRTSVPMRAAKFSSH